MSKRARLFTPGPTEVRPEVLEMLARPVIHHRGEEMKNLVLDILPKLRRLFGTQQTTIFSSSSATGVMEGAIRNCVRRRSLHLVCGAFGERWLDIAGECGKEAGVIRVEPGLAIRPEGVDKELATGKYDAVCVTHNETSTGVTNPIEEIAAVVRRHPDVLLLVDAVSSLGGIRLEFDRLGIDVCLASVQKAIALPPGFTVCALSSRSLEVAREQKGRGHYFDFVRLSAAAAKGMPLATPSIPHLFALQRQLDFILAEGIEERWDRHTRLAERVREWSRDRCGLFAEEGFESNTVTCVANTRNLDVSAFVSRLREKGYLISGGYKTLKEKTFRIGHMGDHSMESVEELLGAMDEVLSS